MNKRRKLVIFITSLIILVAASVVIYANMSREITEEDYKKNPKYLIEEVVVKDGKHLDLPDVKKLCKYGYEDGTASAVAALELSKKAYEDIINQLDNELGIPRVEAGPYKDDYMWYDDSYIEVDEAADEIHEYYQQHDVIGAREEINYIYIFYKAEDNDAKIGYMLEPTDSKFQTKKQGEVMTAIFMVEKYGSYYMVFHRATELDMFLPYR